MLLDINNSLPKKAVIDASSLLFLNIGKSNSCVILGNTYGPSGAQEVIRDSTFIKSIQYTWAYCKSFFPFWFQILALPIGV